MDLPGIDILWLPVGVPTGPKVGSQPVPGCDGRCGAARNVLAQRNPPWHESGPAQSIVKSSYCYEQKLENAG